MARGFGGPIRLTTRAGNHLGFVLFAHEGYPLDAATYESDCVFMPLPRETEVFDDPAYLLLVDHKLAGEHRYKLTNRDGMLDFQVVGSAKPDIFIRVGTNEPGEWGYLTGAEATKMGGAMMAKPKNK